MRWLGTGESHPSHSSGTAPQTVWWSTWRDQCQSLGVDFRHGGNTDGVDGVRGDRGVAIGTAGVEVGQQGHIAAGAPGAA